ncbi:hypothetical protein GLOTRDRAFT_43402 [Gloeophyllum trabeum ATCC 11539]|uniref:AN1-type domain-containing protein n=1 Tax=Gloeophyllum trabeum (strain ATCC 11539 / FP-39264 / Madison 617) TaxID=670483 RepID=S7Q4K3_GLOTA|nr:uncharacterized protein GLOTRDRAFT_43402 [Gloeophyllum trabeum ATCC 11539]EPQ54432.1 hypothetical protein GLOTRDRAFT_43402 [Gloeophyllum trabeum ATCC 11539]
MSDNRDQLLAIGAQCSEATCHLVDFLPFKCQHCNLRYCGDHFKPDAHRCSKYDESKVNRVAPACPLCNTPVAIPPEQDPNIRMERHIQSECSVMTGKAPKKSSPVCGRPKCGKVLFAPITCDKCRKQFCPSHRFPATHNCASTASSAQSKPSSSRSPPIPNMSKALEDLPARTNAALAAVKRSMASQSTPTVNSPRVAAPAVKQASSESSSKSGPGGMRNPFSQVDRRAREERESRRKAMQERARKGLLSEEEKLILAAEEAERAAKKDGECRVM